MKEMRTEARRKNLESVMAFVNQGLEACGCSMKTRMQIELAVEEIFVNIAEYAYGLKTGSATIRLELLDDPRCIQLTFMDSGVPYDPLARRDPDVKLPAEQRAIGGLGIFMVKKVMDAISYRHENGHNILTIRKNL